MAKGFCFSCDVRLSENNSSASRFKSGMGSCRACLASYARDRRKNNPGIDKKHTDIYRRTIQGKYNDLRAKSKKFNRLLEISFDQYLELIKSGFCSYCSKDLSQTGYSLDRVDCTQGYTVENCVSCCASCNRRKGRLEGLGFSSTRSIELLKEIIRSLG